MGLKNINKGPYKMENKLIGAIQYYVDQPVTNYAIMINGKWGSGKTFFWKNTLVEVLEAKGITPIYISLYGVSSIEQIGKKIFLGCMKLSGLGPKGKSSEIFKIAINAIGSISFLKDKLPDLNKVFEGVEFHNLANMDKVILCFDDLERVNMNISDIFGFINTLAEHDNAKIIILTDERKISEKYILNKIEEKTISILYYLAQIKKYKEDGESKKDTSNPDIVSRVNDEIKRFYERSDEYKTIKEKLIGKTIYFEVDYKHIIHKLIEDIHEKNVEKEFMCSRKDAIYNIFNKSNVKNLRILNHSIKDFGQLYSILSNELGKLEDTIMESLLIFVIAFSLEVKSGVINKNVFQNIRTLSELESKLFEFKMFPTDDNQKLSNFFDKYFIKGKHDDCDFVD
jgi:hypothetical protein